MVRHEKYDKFVVEGDFILNLARERMSITDDYYHHVCVYNEQKCAKNWIILHADYSNDQN